MTDALPIVVRPAVPADLRAVAGLAAQLIGYHRELDPQRYMFIDDPARGYEWFFTRELANEKAVILCAARESDGAIVGYAYGVLEDRDWNALLDKHGALHDILVDPSARRQGLAERLVLEICRRLRALGAPRVLLHTAVQNAEAQALFKKLGFRPTMLEMTRESE